MTQADSGCKRLDIFPGVFASCERGRSADFSFSPQQSSNGEQLGQGRSVLGLWALLRTEVRVPSRLNLLPPSGLLPVSPCAILVFY